MLIFDIWTALDSDWAVVYRREPGEVVRGVLGERLRRHTVTLKSPIRYGSQLEAERLIWVADPLQGARRDEALRPAAEIVAFVENWTLDAPLTLDGVAGLHPLVAGAVHAGVMARVYPEPLDTPFFDSWRTRPTTGPEPA